MVKRRIGFSRGIALAFFRNHVQHHRAVERFDIAKNRHQVGNIMTVDRSVVIQVKSRKKSGMGCHEIDGTLLHALEKIPESGKRF